MPNERHTFPDGLELCLLGFCSRFCKFESLSTYGIPLRFELTTLPDPMRRRGEGGERRKSWRETGRPVLGQAGGREVDRG